MAHVCEIPFDLEELQFEETEEIEEKAKNTTVFSIILKCDGAPGAGKRNLDGIVSYEA
jgi:hypothetical protein